PLPEATYGTHPPHRAGVVAQGDGLLWYFRGFPSGLRAVPDIVAAQAPPLPLQERQGGLAGPVPPHGVGEKFQCIAALDHTGPGHGEQAGGGYLAVGALVSE